MSEPRRMPVQLITLEEVVTAADQLARGTRDSGFLPDTIVAIARGGFTPARFLCDFLHVHKLLSVKVEHYTAGAREQRSAAVTHPLSGDIRGEKVLLVDDVNDSGDTLEAALPHLAGFEPSEVRSAVLHEKAGTRRSADYHCHRIREWRWVLYPWAVVEDVGHFVREMDPVPATRAQLHEALLRDYGLQLTPEQTERVIHHNRLPIRD